jgi:hypothetical protein
MVYNSRDAVATSAEHKEWPFLSRQMSNAVRARCPPSFTPLPANTNIISDGQHRSRRRCTLYGMLLL